MKATLLQGPRLELMMQRLCRQLLENHHDFSKTALIGLQPRGALFARQLRDRLKVLVPESDFKYGELDITFHRDDFRTHQGLMLPNPMNIDFSVDGLDIVLMDDVLFTGRTIRAGLDALVDFGRPASVELLVLVDRRFSRQVPIEPQYVGIAVDTRTHQKVKVLWEPEAEVQLLEGSL